MPKIDIPSLPVHRGISSYPVDMRAGTDLYEAVELGEAVGLTQFGVGIETLLPGGLSSLRHWHENEDEFLYMLDGEAVLIEEGGETPLRPGDAVGWKAGVPNGHQIANRSDRPVRFLIVGTRADWDEVHYPDHDLHYSRRDGAGQKTRKDGSPLAAEQTGEDNV